MLRGGLAAAAFLASFACGATLRASVSQEAGISSAQLEAGWERDVDTCTFGEGATPSCDSFLQLTRFQERVKGTMVDVMQSVRRASDKLPENSAPITKFWHGFAIADMQKDLLFLTHALEKMPAMLGLMQTPAKALIKSGSFDAPSSILPVAVEIWGSGWPDKFVGSTGVSLEPTTWREERKYLRPDVHHTRVAKQDQLGSVSFGYSVVRSEPFECYHPERGTKKCVDITLAFKCLSAHGLPTNKKAFCKLRVKKDAETLGAEKFLTEKAKQPRDPIFIGDTWNVTWTEPLLEPILEGDSSDALVPWTLDELTMEEQLQTMLYTLATKVFIRKDQCAKRKNFATRSLCKLLDSFGAMTVDATALEQVIQDAEDQSVVNARDTAMYRTVEEMAELARRAATAEEDGGDDGETHRPEGASMLELAHGYEHRAGNPMMVHASMRARRRRRNGNAPSPRRRGGGHGGCGGGGAIVIIVIIVMSLVILL